MRPPALLDDVAELLELALGAEERAQLKYAKYVHEHTVVPHKHRSLALTRFFVSFLAFLSCKPGQTPFNRLEDK